MDFADQSSKNEYIVKKRLHGVLLSAVIALSCRLSRVTSIKWTLSSIFTLILESKYCLLTNRLIKALLIQTDRRAPSITFRIEEMFCFTTVVFQMMITESPPVWTFCLPLLSHYLFWSDRPGFCSASKRRLSAGDESRIFKNQRDQYLTLWFSPNPKKFQLWSKTEMSGEKVEGQRAAAKESLHQQPLLFIGLWSEKHQWRGGALVTLQSGIITVSYVEKKQKHLCSKKRGKMICARFSYELISIRADSQWR